MGTGIKGLIGSGPCETAQDRVLTFGLDGHEVLTVVDINQGSDLNPTDLSAGGVSVVALDGEFEFRRAPCLQNYPTLEANAAVRFGTFDLAGSFSGWSEESIESTGTGCACATTQGSNPEASGFGAGLVLVGVMRRRARQLRT